MTALCITLSAFALILLLARLKVSLGSAILFGAVALGALFGMGPGPVAWEVVAGALRPNSIALAIITVLLLAVSKAMVAGGQMEAIVSLAKAFVRRPAITMAMLPALIGLLPMPGGALFSAPMVASAANGARESASRLSAINYWFRHIWEHWWPLYPGVILAAELTGRPMQVFIVQQLPLGLGMIISGLLIFRGLHPSLRVTGRPPARGTLARLVARTSSIWIILLIWLAGTLAVRLAMKWMGASADHIEAGTWPSVLNRYAPLAVALVASIIWTVRLNAMKAGELLNIFRQRSLYELALLVLCVMVFQHLLKVTDAAGRIGYELRDLHVPVTAVVMVLPFIAGMVTGLAVGFVGTSFPIVLGLVVGAPQIGPPAAYMVLAYGCGHLGQMLSPLHLCHVVSNRYFKVPFGPVYRRIVPSAAVAFALAVGYFLLLRLLLS